MERILFTGKVEALTTMLNKLSAAYQNFTVYELLRDLTRERRAKAALVGNKQTNTTRTATL